MFKFTNINHLYYGNLIVISGAIYCNHKFIKFYIYNKK